MHQFLIFSSRAKGGNHAHQCPPEAFLSRRIKGLVWSPSIFGCPPDAHQSASMPTSVKWRPETCGFGVTPRGTKRNLHGWTRDRRVVAHPHARVTCALMLRARRATVGTGGAAVARGPAHEWHAAAGERRPAYTTRWRAGVVVTARREQRGGSYASGCAETHCS
jgi:hypothetical protein